VLVSTKSVTVSLCGALAPGKDGPLVRKLLVTLVLGGLLVSTTGCPNPPTSAGKSAPKGEDKKETKEDKKD
jgi:hypothetical protein